MTLLVQFPNSGSDLFWRQVEAWLDANKCSRPFSALPAGVTTLKVAPADRLTFACRTQFEIIPDALYPGHGYFKVKLYAREKSLPAA
jgi:hypothetical protein